MGVQRWTRHQSTPYTVRSFVIFFSLNGGTAVQLTLSEGHRPYLYSLRSFYKYMCPYSHSQIKDLEFPKESSLDHNIPCARVSYFPMPE